MTSITDSLNRIQSLEELAEGKTLLHRIHPMAKMITTIFFLVVVISFDKYNVSGLIPFFIYPILLMSIGEIPYRSVLSISFRSFFACSAEFQDRPLP
jgi:cobalt/nickel transport system permease protein